MEFIGLAVRSAQDQYFKPRVIKTSDWGPNYVMQLTGKTAAQIATSFEGFVLGGALGSSMHCFPGYRGLIIAWSCRASSVPYQ